MKMMMKSEGFAGIGSTIASIMFLWAMCRQYFPYQLHNFITKYSSKIMGLIYPYIEISFPEYVGNHFRSSEAYTAIESYLSITTTERAKRLKAKMGYNNTKLILSLAEHEEITDEFNGVKLWWFSSRTSSTKKSISFYPADEEKRSYRLTFHCRYRQLITDSYLPFVIREGKAIDVRKRQRKLYTNSSNFDYTDFKKLVWSHVPFEHPATFESIAMEPEMKRDIIQDLVKFSKSKEYYAKIGKPWKRGYLLYGPPGTGKSTMIAAMANLLDYDVYDLELTAVKDNSALRKLLLNTTSKSIIVVEDIDCSLDLSGKRKADGASEGNKEAEEAKKMMKGGDHKEESKVTLSGLLNCIDGLWSACGGEKVIVFTTNHVDKLDPALIRRGRMDKHIELSYCGYQGFKILAKNYLGVDESHPLFENIHQLLEEKNISPADVAESLMPKNSDSENQVDACLENLVQALKDCKSKSEMMEEKQKQVKIKEAVQVANKGTLENGHKMGDSKVTEEKVQV